MPISQYDATSIDGGVSILPYLVFQFESYRGAYLKWLKLIKLNG